MAIFKTSTSLKNISDLSSFAYQETIHLFINYFMSAYYVPHTVQCGRFQSEQK